MKRLILLLLTISLRLVGWLSFMRKDNKNKTMTFKEKYDYVHSKVLLVNKKVKDTEIKCFGLENLPEENGYLITPNHQGMFDALILLGTHSRPLTAVAKIELVDKPILGTIIEFIEALPMDRSNLRASIKVIKEAASRIRQGVSIVIFPEGTRAKNGNQMIEFKGGSFKAGIDAKAPIVPVALIDCYKPFDKDVKGKIITQIHYLEPLYYDDYHGMSSQEIADLVQARIKACIDEHEHDYK